jgi:hypothetical protein
MSTTDHVAPDPAQDPAIDRRRRAFLKELIQTAENDVNALRDVPATAAALRRATAEPARPAGSRG